MWYRCFARFSFGFFGFCLFNCIFESCSVQRDFCAESEVNGNLHFGTTVSVGRGKEEYFCSSSFTNIVNAFVFANICQ